MRSSLNLIQTCTHSATHLRLSFLTRARTWHRELADRRFFPARRTAGSGGSSISAQHELLARWLRHRRRLAASATRSNRTEARNAPYEPLRKPPGPAPDRSHRSTCSSAAAAHTALTNTSRLRIGEVVRGERQPSSSLPGLGKPSLTDRRVRISRLRATLVGRPRGYRTGSVLARRAVPPGRL